MSEQEWSNRKEWKTERGEIESKGVEVIPFDTKVDCDVEGCYLPALYTFEVGLVQNKSGAKFDFCAEHGDSDFACEYYLKMRKE